MQCSSLNFNPIWSIFFTMWLLELVILRPGILGPWGVNLAAGLPSVAGSFSAGEVECRVHAETEMPAAWWELQRAKMSCQSCRSDGNDREWEEEESVGDGRNWSSRSFDSSCLSQRCRPTSHCWRPQQVLHHTAVLLHFKFSFRFSVTRLVSELGLISNAFLVLT